MTPKRASLEVCRWAQELLTAHVATDQTGCLSLRAGDTMVITPESVPLSELTPEGLSWVCLKQGSLQKGPRPDSRFALHAAIYKKRKKTHAIIHSQSLAIMTASKAGVEVPPLLDDMAQIVGISAKVATSWSDRKVRPVLSALKGRDAVLLKDAGALCAGSNVDDALAVAQVLEKGCKAYIESSFLGGGAKINRAEALFMRTVYKLKYSKQNTTNT
ncbi:MAG: class II aldolase/adducin family protein [Desulfobacterales bacterium]|nr:class II aldolase/adducin family protein [Desulfobacterales bacterium]